MEMGNENYGVCMIGMKEVVFEDGVVYIMEVHGLGRSQIHDPNNDVLSKEL